PRDPHSLPTRRSSDLASNHWAWGRSAARSDDFGKTWEQRTPGLAFPENPEQPIPNLAFDDQGGLTDKGRVVVENIWAITPGHERDRKSTRLNSSHVKI